MFRVTSELAGHRLTGLLRLESAEWRNLGWLFADRGLRLLVNLIVGAWVGRYLGPAQFGVLASVLAVLAIAQAIAPLGLDNIAVRELAKSADPGLSVMGTLLVMRLAWSFVCYGSLLGFAWWYRPDDHYYLGMVAIAGAVILFQVMDVVDLWFQSRLQARRTVGARLLGFGAANGLRVVFVLLERPLLDFVWLLLLEASLAAFMLWRTYTSIGQFRAWECSMERAKGFLQEAWPYLLAGAMLALYLQADKLLLLQYAGPASVGAYSGAMMVFGLLGVIPMLVCSSLAPRMARLEMLERDPFFVRLIAWLWWSGVAIGAVLVVAGNGIVHLLLGDAYQAAGPVLSILALAIPVVFLSVVNDYFALNMRKSGATLARTMFGLTISIGLNVVLAPSLGAMGAAISAVCAHALANTILYWMVMPQARGLFFRGVVWPFRRRYS